MNKNTHKIFSYFLLFLSVFFISLFYDHNFNSNKIFNNLSLFFYNYTLNILGNFSLLFISIFFIIGLFLLLKIKKITKIFIISGYILLVFFLPVFFETFKIFNLNGGLFGIYFSNIFLNLKFAGYLSLYFFWFLLSIFLISYPIRNHLVVFISNIFNNLRINNFNNNNSKVFTDSKSIKQKNKKSNYPWLSKIIFDNYDSRVEIPVIPKKINKTLKFKLLSSNEKEDYYQEIDPSLTKNEKIKYIEYYDKIKENSPEGWKSDNKDELLLENNIDLINDNILNHPDTLENKKEYFYIDKNKNDKDSKHLKNSDLKKINNNISHEKFSKKNINNTSLPESDILINEKENINSNVFDAEHKESSEILEQTLLEFDIEARVTDIIHGPVVTLYKIAPAPGIKLQKIEGLSNNLALRLAAKSIRIIAPIPGERVVGIEIPNKNRILVSFKEIVNSEEFSESTYNIPIGLGRDIYGKIIVIDLFKMPHILIAGATGAGKSVCVNAIISSILFSKTPEDVKLVLIDPKIVELKPYNNIPHLLTPVIIDPKEAINVLKYLLIEMERRYSLLDEMGARDIVEYQKKKKNQKNNIELEYLPFIVAIIDEFADLLSTSGKESEILFSRLAAKARAVGIHLVLATQRPSADVITGLIKANIPARIAFQVIALQDSRIILDQKGAEKLLGQGDLLYLSPTQPYPIRIQGAFLSKDEVDLIASHWKSISEPNYIDIKEFINEVEESENEYDGNDVDPLFQQALDIIYETQKASASYLQRRLGIGYNRAARIVEEMEKMGIVGPQRGAKPREIISYKPPF